MRPDFRQLNWNSTIEDDLRQIVRLAVREAQEPQPALDGADALFE